MFKQNIIKIVSKFKLLGLFLFSVIKIPFSHKGLISLADKVLVSTHRDSYLTCVNYTLTIFHENILPLFESSLCVCVILLPLQLHCGIRNTTNELIFECNQLLQNANYNSFSFVSAE